MKVLSCFDGMSCGQIAFERAGIPIEKYYASEIDKYAIAVTMANYPDTVQLGSITEWRSWNIEHPDIIIGGSPCQGFSFAGKGLNFEDERSKLFFVFVDILKYYKPKYFLLENVVMKKEHNDVISGILGEIYPECVTQTELFRTGRLEPIQINSALVSAQNRNRLYWTNIPGIEQPEDKEILLKDIIETNPNKKYYISDKRKKYQEKIDRTRVYRIDDKKTGCILKRQNGGSDQLFFIDEKGWRQFTPIELERLQNVSDNYTSHVSDSQRFCMLGNGWTVDVIVHIFKNIEY
jgi:DNA-cytosine methyltransferase